MNLEDIDIDKIEKQFAALKKRAANAKEFYQSLEKLPLEKVIDGVSDDVDDTITAFLPVFKKTRFAQWKTRAIPIEAVNKILVEFELEVAKEYTSTISSVIARQLIKTLAIVEWMTTHKLIVFDVARLIQQQILKITWEGMPYVNPMVYVMAAFSPEARVGLKDIAVEKYKAQRDFIEKLAAVMVLLMTISLVEGIVGAFELLRSKSQWAILNRLIQDALSSLEAKSFPQAKGRWRRQARHRIRSKRGK